MKTIIFLFAITPMLFLFSKNSLANSKTININHEKYQDEKQLEFQNNVNSLQFAADSNQYTCPMHPEVKAVQPGYCPKCGMQLVKANNAKTEEQHNMGMMCGMHHHNGMMMGGILIGVMMITMMIVIFSGHR